MSDIVEQVRKNGLAVRRYSDDLIHGKNGRNRSLSGWVSAFSTSSCFASDKHLGADDLMFPDSAALYVCTIEDRQNKDVLIWSDVVTCRALSTSLSRTL